MRHWYIFGFGVLLSFVQVAEAQELVEDPLRRRLVVSSIRAATDCIAHETLSEFGLLDYVRNNRLDDTLNGPIRRCSDQIRYMIEEFDRVYYPGAGAIFYKGAYRADLPRAVLARIQGEVDRRQAEKDRQQVEEQNRQDEMVRRRQEQERLAGIKRSDEREEFEMRQAQRKLERMRMEVEQRAEQIRLDLLMQQELVTARKAIQVAQDRIFVCAYREIGEMVVFGESVVTVATATLALCRSELEQVLEAFVGLRRIETGGKLGLKEIEAVKIAGRANLKDILIELVAKSKAARTA